MIDFNTPPTVKLPTPGDPPDSSLESKDLRGLPLSGLLATINHVLSQQAWSRERLQGHKGKAVRLGVDASFPLSVFAPNLFARIDDDGLLQPAQGGRADVSLWLKPTIDALFKGLQEGPVALAGHLRIEGDVLLAGVLGELAQHLRWDAQEDLSRIVGDAVAHRVGSTTEQAGQTLRESGSRLQNQTSQFLTAGQGPLIDRSSFDNLKAEINDLRKRIDRLNQG